MTQQLKPLWNYLEEALMTSLGECLSSREQNEDDNGNSNNSEQVERRSKLMAKRECDCCGHEKDVWGGKVCENGHFICSSCAYGRSTCPLCGKRLR